MRKFFFIYIALWLCALAANAEEFQLADGRTLNGEPLLGTAKDEGIQIKTGEGQYEKVSWASFSQADLKKFLESPKIAPFVEPFIEISQQEKLKKTEVAIKPVPRLERPVPRSFFGAMFSNSLGLLMMVLLYAANIYAAFEVAVFRARPPAVVCGVAAVLPIVGPIIFLSLPTLMERHAGEEIMQADAPSGAGREVLADSPLASAPKPEGGSPEEQAAGGLHIAHAEAYAAPAADLPQTQVFQRGAFTFNRRFFETKFPGFFGVVRREAEKDLLLVIKAARGEYTGTRITRIAGNDLHLEIHKGAASEEVLIPFTEIKEVQLKHKDAQ